MKTWLIIAVMHTTWAFVRLKSEKNSGLNGVRTHDLCDTGAVLYQLSYQATLGAGHFVSDSQSEWVKRQSEHIFAPNGGYCVYIIVPIFFATSAVLKIAWELVIIQSRDAFRPIACERKYLLDYKVLLYGPTIRVVPLSLSPTCVTRKKTARKKWPRDGRSALLAPRISCGHFFCRGFLSRHAWRTKRTTRNGSAVSLLVRYKTFTDPLYIS